MTKNVKFTPLSRTLSAIFSVALSLGFLTLAAPAFADETEALAAINRADAKIEMVTRQAGLAGDNGDQSFNMARQKLIDARAALSAGQYNTAEMLAQESSLLAALTAEKATLASLQTSHDNLVKSASVAVQ